MLNVISPTTISCVYQRLVSTTEVIMASVTPPNPVTPAPIPPISLDGMMPLLHQPITIPLTRINRKQTTSSSQHWHSTGVTAMTPR